MWDMPHFLVEIRLTGVAPPELERLAWTLEAAQARLHRTPHRARVVVAGVCAEEGLFVCLLEAPSIAAVRHLASTALLPPGHVREIVALGPPSRPPRTPSRRSARES